MLHVFPSGMMALFDADYVALTELYDAFISNGISLRDLATQLASSKITAISNAEILVSDIESSVFAKLIALADNFETSATTIYNTLMAMLSGLQSFLPNDDTLIEQFMRKRLIWRMPSFNQQNPQV
jgi:hypothetical protein